MCGVAHDDIFSKFARRRWLPLRGFVTDFLGVSACLRRPPVSVALALARARSTFVPSLHRAHRARELAALVIC